MDEITDTLRAGPVQRVMPENTCFGCGPANDAGLGLESYLSDDGDALVATFDPDPEFSAGVPHVMYGGLIASLVDCHSLWTVLTFTVLDGDPSLKEGLPRFATRDLSVTYERPTPLDEPFHLRAWIDGDIGERTTVASEVGPEGTVTARGEVVGVDVTDRW